VSWLSGLIAPFPYERLSHVQSSTRFGGMENAGTIFYSDAAFRNMTLGEGLVAHETAHQWFGDAVTPLRWADLWLSEGFATYFAALWEREARGDTAFRRALDVIKRRVVGAPEVASRPVVDTAQTDLMGLLNANSYQKGGIVLHMLRQQIGDSAWFRGVRAYYAAHRHANATTDDLLKAMEAESKTDLRWFFDQWVRRPGFAELSTSWTFENSLSLRISQGSRFGPYRLKVTIEVEEADGTIARSTLDVPATRESQMAIGGKRTQRPRRVSVDPDGDLLAVITAR
jgi:aminopeptidase N